MILKAKSFLEWYKCDIRMTYSITPYLHVPHQMGKKTYLCP